MQWGGLDEVRLIWIVRLDGKFDRYLGMLKMHDLY